MTEFIVLIEEVLTKEVRVTADSDENAENLVKKMYENKEVALKAPEDSCVPTAFSTLSKEEYDYEHGVS